MIKTTPKKKKCKKAKWLLRRPHQQLRKEEKLKAKEKRKKGKIYPFEYRVPKNSKER